MRAVVVEETEVVVILPLVVQVPLDFAELLLGHGNPGNINPETRMSLLSEVNVQRSTLESRVVESSVTGPHGVLPVYGRAAAIGHRDVGMTDLEGARIDEHQDLDIPLLLGSRGTTTHRTGPFHLPVNRAP